VKFEAAPVRQDGYLMPKWQQHHVWRVGELYVDERRDGDLNRTVRVARFTEPMQPARDLMPPLHDVKLVTAKPDLFTLTGYEVSTSNGGKPVHYRQSWVLRPVTDAELQGRDASRERERARMAEFMRVHGGGDVLPCLGDEGATTAG
jgi:hypothetical protein